MIQTATAMAMAAVSATKSQRPVGVVALSKPNEIPLFSTQVRLNTGSSTICALACNCSGTVTIHLVS